MGSAPLGPVTAGLVATYLPFAIGLSYTGSPLHIPFQIYLFSISLMGAPLRPAFIIIIDYMADKACSMNTFSVKFEKRAASFFNHLV